MNHIYVAAAVIVNHNKTRILLTKRQGGQFDGLWEFPGGKIEGGETSKETVVREIEEELSLNIQVIDYFITIEYGYENFYLTMQLFWSKIESGKLSLNEHSDYLWATKEQLGDLDWVPADIQLIDKIKSSSFLQ